MFQKELIMFKFASLLNLNILSLHKCFYEMRSLKYAIKDSKEFVSLSSDVSIYQGSICYNIEREMFRVDIIGICIVESGTYSVSINNKKYKVREGEILIGHPNDLISDISFSKNFHGTMILASSSFFSDILTPELFKEALSKIKCSPLFNIEENYKSLISSYCTTINQLLLSNILEHYKNSCLLLAKALMTDVFNLIIGKNLSLPQVHKFERRPKLIYEDFINLLLSLNNKPRDLNFYAMKLCVSTKYLSYVCRKERGMTAPKIITEFIMNDVYKYLTGSSLTIKEIANTTGFTNCSFFCKSVRKYFGKSSLRIRQEETVDNIENKV